MLKAYKYFSIFYVNLRSKTAHMPDVLSRAPVMLLRLWILERLYSTAYLSAGAKNFGGLSVAQIIWIVMIVQCLTISTRPRVSAIIDEEVKSGALAYTINRPYSYILFHYFGFFGRMIPGFLTIVIAGIVSALLVSGAISVTITAFFGAILLLLGGFTLDFFIRLSLGLLAFWLEDTTAFSDLYDKSVAIVGGWFFPLALFPKTVQTVCEYLPFSQLGYGAARLFVNFDGALFFRYLTLQAAWIIIMIVVALMLYRKGMRNVSIQGG